MYGASANADKIFKMTGDDWWEFEKQVKKNNKFKPNNIRSFDIALILCENDNEKAFDLWAKWFTEFKAIQDSKKAR